MHIEMFLKAHSSEYLILIICSIVIPFFLSSVSVRDVFQEEVNKSRFYWVKLYLKNFSLIFIIGGLFITIFVFVFSFIKIFTGSDTIMFIITSICLWSILKIRKINDE